MNRKTNDNIFLRGLVPKDRRSATLLLTEMAVLTAIVVVLQLLGSFIRFGVFSISLVLVPIVVGAALYGPLAGAWLGFVFGFVVLISGDATLFFQINPIGTVVTVLLKGTAAGFVSGLVYRLIEKKDALVAVFASAAVCPIVNTGVFLLGCAIFFLPTMREWSAGARYTNVFAYMIFGLVGGNFIFELGANIILSPPVHKLLELIERKIRARFPARRGR